MKTEQIFDIYAIDYQKKFNENPVTEYQRKIIHDELKLLLSPGNEILDAGCGPGSDFEFYKLFNLKVSAFDFSLNMIRLAQKKAQELNLDANVFQSDIYEFCPDIKFDIIILNFGVLNALPDADNILLNIKNWLNENGILVAVVMPPFQFFALVGDLKNFHFRQPLKRIFLKRVILKSGIPVYYYSKKDIGKNFKIIKRINLGVFLPTPDQYQNSNMAKGLFYLMKKFNRLAGKFVPSFLGGDHICYIMKKM